MNKLIKEIKSLINKSINEYLPDIKPSDLEDNGAIFYMNGRNGTEFDWHVNEKISNFMVFYNDEKNLGAAKFTICNNGGVLGYIYGEQGNVMIEEIKTFMDVPDDEILKLAVILKNQADDQKLWDANIDSINTDVEISEDKITEFQESRQYYEPSINRTKILNSTAYVSRRILEDGWKVGYMCREEALNEHDSGWSFVAGNEDDDYINDSKNIALLMLYQVCQIDPDIWNYIDKPTGTKLIRISSNEFEIDNNDKEIYTEKRN